MAELREWLASERGVSVCLATAWKTLDRFGLTFKKKSLRAAEQDRADVAAAREAWRANRNLTPNA